MARLRTLTAVYTLFGLVTTCCGGDTQVQQSNDVCVPKSRPWLRWVPPVAPRPGVCTADQIQEDYARCYAPFYDHVACDVFARDPANAACLGCLISPVDASAYAAVVIQADHSAWATNIAGCMALVDGDASATGCAAKEQAYRECSTTACLGCRDPSFQSCFQGAKQTVCGAQFNAAICDVSAKYAICTDYADPGAFFLAMGTIFCVSGLALPQGGGPSGSTDAATAP